MSGLTLKQKFIGDKAFYRMVMLVALPIMIQNGFTNLVSLLDNVMVGRVGTEQMSGVSIVNQLMFVFNLSIFGAFSGAGIFTAQYYGQEDNTGIRETVRFKLIAGVFVCLVACALFVFCGRPLVSLYLNEGSDGDLAMTLSYALDYIKVIVWTMPLFMFQQMFSTTLRECGETVLPMKAGIYAVLVNLVFNWLLIYGKLGFPCMGVVGAAIATLLSRIVETLIVCIWSYRHKDRFPFMDKLFRSLRIRPQLFKSIFRRGTPLLMNEFCWSAGMAVLTQCYSTRGLDSVAGFNISGTVINLFKIVFLAMANAIGIIVGNMMGAGKMEEAVDTDRKMIAFSVFLSALISLIMVSTASVFPNLYNTNANAREIARLGILVGAVYMPLDAYICGCYFTIRSGGRTWVTFMFDGAYTWIVSVAIAFCLSRFTSLPSVWIFFFVNVGDLIKTVVGTILLKKRVWLHTIVV